MPPRPRTEVPDCLVTGESPAKAATCFALRNSETFGISARIVIAVVDPMPGIDKVIMLTLQVWMLIDMAVDLIFNLLNFSIKRFNT